jgi:hypothetical protein
VPGCDRSWVDRNTRRRKGVGTYGRGFPVDLSHPGTKSTAKLVAQRFAWPGHLPIVAHVGYAHRPSNTTSLLLNKPVQYRSLGSAHKETCISRKRTKKLN